MTALQRIEEAEKYLPYTSEIECDRYRVIVQNQHHSDLDMVLHLNDTPNIYDFPFYEVEFRKQYVSGIVVGWEFVGIVNGI